MRSRVIVQCWTAGRGARAAGTAAGLSVEPVPVGRAVLLAGL